MLSDGEEAAQTVRKALAAEPEIGTERLDHEGPLPPSLWLQSSPHRGSGAKRTLRGQDRLTQTKAKHTISSTVGVVCMRAYMCMCVFGGVVCIHMWVWRSAGVPFLIRVHHGSARRSPKRASDLLPLELLEVGSQPMWVLGDELWSSINGSECFSPLSHLSSPCFSGWLSFCFFEKVSLGSPGCPVTHFESTEIGLPLPTESCD